MATLVHDTSPSLRERLASEAVGDAFVPVPETFASDAPPPAQPGEGAVEYGRPILYPTTGNPTPERITAGTIATPDGLILRTALCEPRVTPRGTVLLLQGRNECIEKYFETMSDLAARGFATLTFDWRGQGGSERILKDPVRGHVASFRHYETDLRAMLDGPLAKTAGPVTLVGHSMGSLIALLVAPDLPERVRRMVLLAPLIRLTHQPLGHKALRVVTRLIRLLGLGRLYAAMGPRPRAIPEFLSNVLTTDRHRHERNGTIFVERPGLGMGGPTIAWLNSALRAMSRVTKPDHLARVSLPSVMIAAGDDQVVSTLAIEQTVRSLRNANVLTVDGARHELLQERDRYREQVLVAIEAFAAKR